MQTSPLVQIPDLNLDVKALVQPLGSENNWNELGDGKIEFHGHSIRVVNYDAVTNHVASRNGDVSETDNNGDQDDSELFPSQPSPQVVLEDTISDDTPFVGENSCIVWNSLEQQLSLCIMFMEDRGYSAAWSALHAIQHKPYPPVDFDVLAPCRQAADSGRSKSGGEQQGPEKEGGNNESTENGAAENGGSDEEVPPPPAITYESIINQHHLPPLGYIEMHAIACSIMEFNHGAEPSLFGNVHTCVTLLKFCHADLLEYCVSGEVYQNLLAGLESTAKVALWSVPAGLETLFADGLDDLTDTINTALRLHHLKHEVLPVGIDEEVIAVIDSLHHRLHNELICAMLADESLFKSVVNTLMTTSAAVGGKDGDFTGRKSSSRGARSPRSSDEREKRAKKEKKDKKRKNSSNNLKDVTSDDVGSDSIGNSNSGSHNQQQQQGGDILSQSHEDPIPGDDCEATHPPSKSCSPHPPASAPDAAHVRPGTGTINSSSSNSSGKPPVAGEATSSSVLSPDVIIANTLHFLTNFFSIAVSAFAKELMSHLIAKVFEAGLLEALSLVAQKFLNPPVGMTPMPLGEGEGFGLTLTSAHPPPNVTETQIPPTITTSAPAPASRESSSRQSNHSRGRSAGRSTGHHSALVEQHMITFLDATITRLNEKAEESVLNAIFRKPICDEPEKYMALVVFVGRCLLRDAQEFIGMNSMLAFHLLGLHDDEGSNCDRYGDPETVTEKQAFQKFFIESVLKDICRGRIMPLPSYRPLSPQQVSQIGISSFGSTSGSAVDIRGEARNAVAEANASGGAEKPRTQSPQPSLPGRPGSTTSCSGSPLGGDDASPVQAPKSPSLGGTIPKPSNSTMTTISPPFIRVLEYLFNLTSEANRKTLTSTILHPKSYVMKFIEMLARNTLVGAPVVANSSFGGSFGDKANATTSSSSRKSPSILTTGAAHANRTRIENLTGNVRFLRALLQHGGLPALRHCTVDRDILKPYLQLYQSLGGPRKRSLFHSTVLSLVFLIHDNPTLDDCQRYLLLRHRDILPVEFTQLCDEDALQELTSRIQGIENGVHMTPIPSRAATPNVNRDLNGAVVHDSTPGSSEKKRGRHLAVDEVNEPSSPESMEEVATFPPRLRTMIGRLSPTPHDKDKQPSPTHDELAVPKQPRKPSAPSASKASTGRVQRPRGKGDTGSEKFGKGSDEPPATNGKTLLRNLDK